MENGDVTLHLEYELPGMSSVTVQWKVMRNASKATVVFRMNKENRWEPENVYLSLPFLRQDGELWVDKAGAALRPWRDQIPGTCMDYSSVQAGVAVIRDNGGLVIGMPDSPLVYLGDLEHRPRRLFDPHENVKPDELYSWIMNNFWETNFNAGLGGIYEFRYVLEWGKHLELPQQAFERCQSNVQGLTVVRI
ncbi:hypothetical protein [Paenibacillus sp. MY03]|uniref:hypothetical protein n=1 Tax=Paenibacillus sp. MY03 TaxID=302980 RepID=UPI00117CFEDC|nr:hypothetical protein [Paenibacillus sp. MY03]